MIAILPSLMIVNDDPLIREEWASALSDCFKIHQAGSYVEVMDLLHTLPDAPQLVLINLDMVSAASKKDEGFRLIAELKAYSPVIRIFALSGQNEQSNARALGTIDFISTPCASEKIRKYLSDALAVMRRENNQGDQDRKLFGIVGQSPAIQALRSQIAMYAPMPFPVLIEGESGCGKELIAAAIQKLGKHPDGPFKALNCAAISPNLIEATLFGYGKGAFTGAVGTRAGFFEDASDGTLFLDEIGELSLELQTKLLRVLENGEYQRVGETVTRKSHARIIAATNRNLRNAVKAGAFRTDLYHRLNVYSIKVPPLRELGQDKQILLDHFQDYFARQTGQRPFEFHPEALQLWERYSFPGNTRELRNIVIRLNTKYPGQLVSRMQLQDEFDPLETAGNMQTAVFSESIKLQLQQGRFRLDQHLHEQEGCYIQAALGLSSGNISAAAKLLGINRTTLHSRMDTHENLDSLRLI